MLKIALLDDEKAALIISKGAIEAFLEDKQIQYSLGAFSSSVNLLASAKEEKYNLYFLDIDVPEINGLETAKKIAEFDSSATIIFLSQREDLVFECLSLHPFGFIRKSKLIEDFGLMMGQYLSTHLSMEKNAEKIEFTEGGSVHLYSPRDVIFIESDRNYQKVVLSNENEEDLRIREPMNELEKRLEPFGFIRIHKSILVNYLFIRSVSAASVTLIGGADLPLAKNRREEVLKKFLALSRKQAFAI